MKCCNNLLFQIKLSVMPRLHAPEYNKLQKYCACQSLSLPPEWVFGWRYCMQCSYLLWMLWALICKKRHREALVQFCLPLEGGCPCCALTVIGGPWPSVWSLPAVLAVLGGSIPSEHHAVIPTGGHHLPGHCKMTQHCLTTLRCPHCLSWFGELSLS